MDSEIYKIARNATFNVPNLNSLYQTTSNSTKTQNYSNLNFNIPDLHENKELLKI